MSYRNLAVNALTKCVGYDALFPNASEVMILAWAEALEDAKLDNEEDILMAVRVMYRNHGDPGWRPTPRVLVNTAKEVRDLRLRREALMIEKQLEGPKKVTYAEFRASHPEVEFPKLGKEVTDGRD